MQKMLGRLFKDYEEFMSSLAFNGLCADVIQKWYADLQVATNRRLVCIPPKSLGGACIPNKRTRRL